MNDLINLYRQRLNLENATFQRVDHDDAMVAVVYKITRPNGKQYILKIGFTIKRGTWNTLHSRVYQFNRRFLETFF